MSQLIRELLSDRSYNHLHPFTGLRPSHSYEQIEQTALNYKAAGIYSMNLLWGSDKGSMRLAPYNDEVYWERMRWVVEICRKHGMTFMLQDAAPFPTGEADGWFARTEYAHLNKRYLAERHMDVVGPNPEAAILVANMVGAILPGDDRNDAKRQPGDRLLSLTAMRYDAAGKLDGECIDLMPRLRDGLLHWAIPEGTWRIHAVYETYNGHGRPNYMNLLDPDSVALNIQAVHRPHYEHLKEEIGKTWLGFFYDETEIGNLDGVFFDARLGRPRDLYHFSMDLPWSDALRERIEASWGAGFAQKLPLLWAEAGSNWQAVRCSYMDHVSRLLQETYNGQMHRWCRERGIGYVGHNLEDENSHCRLASGPVHYFRMQKHQDMAGIDLIGGQLMPGKDGPHGWYGCTDSDGRFYHYGLSKLPSSAAHIDPHKQSKALSETFAVYGSIAGTRLRKFVLDHQFVNGINELVPVTSCTRRENDYAQRMCELLQRTKSVIKTAVLYHAEAEWYGGNYQMFQLPAQQLAQHQISYDIIPADVFEDQKFYQTDLSEGLSINGNRYEALIIPGADAIPAAAADFIQQAAATGFPIFFSGWMPNTIAETGAAYVPPYGSCVALDALAEAVSAVISCDVILNAPVTALRYAHQSDAEGDYYLLHNEGKAFSATLTLPHDGPVYQVNLDCQQVRELGGERDENGLHLQLDMAEFEATILYVGAMEADAAPQAAYTAVPLNAEWTVTLDDGTRFLLKELVNLNGADYYPLYSGKMIYETTVHWDSAPAVLDLGAVFEQCRVYCNDALVGETIFAPYRVEIPGSCTGDVRLRIEVQPNTARQKRLTGKEIHPAMAMVSCTASAYNVLDPGGVLGPVKQLYKA